MHVSWLGLGAVAGGLLSASCAAKQCPCETTPNQAGGSAPAAVAAPASTAPGAAGTEAAGPPADSGPPSQGAPLEPPSEPPLGTKSLPQIIVRNVGLHVGGGTNAEPEKEPFKRAIEARFDDFMRCYRTVEEPLKGGTFGVDLFIGRAGGRPDVRQPRTGIKGSEFRECMTAAFSSVAFERPKAGPTVISYSLKFEVEGG